MKRLLTLLIIVLVVAMVSAQDEEEGCTTNPEALIAIVNQLADATEIEDIEQILLDIRLESISQQMTCYDFAEGQTRVNPILNGQMAEVQSETFDGFMMYAGFEIQEEYGEDYIVAMLKVECLYNAANACQLNHDHFFVVGDDGRAIESEFVLSWDDELYLFGGGNTVFEIPFPLRDSETSSYMLVYAPGDDTETVVWFSLENN